MARMKHNSLYYTINSETLFDNKSLSVSDAQMQFLNPGSMDRNILLPSEANSAGLSIFIVNTNDSTSVLQIYEDSETELLADINPGKIAMFACDGLKWYNNL